MTARADHVGGLAPDAVVGDVRLDPADPALALTAAQRQFFSVFGFVHLPGLFRAEIGRILAGFDAVFEAEAAIEYRHALHYDDLRAMIAPGFVDRSEDLRWLRDDPRLHAVVASVLPDGYEFVDSDGNLFSCDTAWHSDIFGADMERFNVKVYFYLDELTADTGALRVIPGTNSLTTPYAVEARRALWEPDGAETVFGIPADEVPCWIIETQPGDVVIGDFRTLHATFHGGPNRRLFTLNYRDLPSPASSRGSDVAV